jgi:hypothetical protein
MNERIELPIQGWLGFDPEKGDIHGYTFEQMREFAELIVRECAAVAYSYDPLEPVPNAIARLIQEHFGVSDAT